MILEKGTKIHVITRRLFDGDLRRHFAGEVLDVTDHLARVRGYAFIFETWTNAYVRKPELRERLFGLADAGLIINILPDETDLEKLQYVTTRGNRLVLTDGGALTLDINEFGSRS